MPITVETRRMQRTGEGAMGERRQCELQGCTRSAGSRVQLFPAHFDYLCAIHAREWERTYDLALANWPAAVAA